jgi:hypothetical protein
MDFIAQWITTDPKEIPRAFFGSSASFSNITNFLQGIWKI